LLFVILALIPPDDNQEFIPMPGFVGSQAEINAWNAHCVGQRAAGETSSVVGRVHE